jgi:hypothetical protein
MTTSSETASLDHPTLRHIVNEVESLSVADRATLLKGLVPVVARDMSPKDFESLISELRLKGERFYDASLHPGEGRASRHVMGERDLEGR